ncbi:hypothetical protein KIN20_013960 [Parelaphostrongylus tenuis]|uniref:Transmembrane protein n=1 Tax=Parelaphostrongylus tenuis TaxID=148309 RepID=A0AAD5N2N5_PARTN|nr:hypothetical protein KIN20_013960 [Parelaphostrongylus tenuis]
MAFQPTTNRAFGGQQEERARCTECCRTIAEEENFAGARQRLSEYTLESMRTFTRLGSLNVRVAWLLASFIAGATFIVLCIPSTKSEELSD